QCLYTSDTVYITLRHCRHITYSLRYNMSLAADINPLSLHDALPIYPCPGRRGAARLRHPRRGAHLTAAQVQAAGRQPGAAAGHRSEEHTSELQSHENIVCRLLLEKKNEDLIPPSHVVIAL